MNTEERIVEFFRRNRGQDICDACLASHLQLGSGKNATMARNTTAVLGAVYEIFARSTGQCPKCGKTRLVTRWRS